ncbi:hypothetical protein J4233_01775 [Candidatus Pacearchaeota archaeon]|nr:hypothetical protein [Candidatus Pacearchaeota archaeon]
MQKKRGIAIDMLIYWIIAAAVVVFVIISYIWYSGSLGNMGSYLKDWLRFGK